MFTANAMVWSCGSSTQPVFLDLNKRTRCFFMISQLHCYANELARTTSVVWSFSKAALEERPGCRASSCSSRCVRARAPQTQPLYPAIFNLLPGLRKNQFRFCSRAKRKWTQFPEEKLDTCFLSFHSAGTFGGKHTLSMGLEPFLKPHFCNF